jgi:hypothetical protein
MARHSASRNPTARRLLPALTAAGIAVGAGAASAAADTDPVVDVVRTRPTSFGNIDPRYGLQALTGTVGYVTVPVAGLKPNPPAGTGAHPLDNTVGTQLADFKPVNTGMVTRAQSLGSVPVREQATGLLR